MFVINLLRQSCLLTAFGIALAIVNPALAYEAGDCQARSGDFVTGIVVSGPQFKRGEPRSGGGLTAELSHTHLRFTKDGDTSGATYDVAIDNVYASGYDAAGERVPSPLDKFQVGDHIEMCGQGYPDGTGIHFVHPNCGDTPTPSEPDGWIKEIAQDGTVGPNIESNLEYCPLWRH